MTRKKNPQKVINSRKSADSRHGICDIRPLIDGYTGIKTAYPLYIRLFRDTEKLPVPSRKRRKIEPLRLLEKRVIDKRRLAAAGNSGDYREFSLFKFNTYVL